MDVGRAAGAYALRLAEAGYAVHLIDPVPRLVAEAQRRSAAAPRPLASCRIGDARDLGLPDDTADVVLLLGPLYHLTHSRDRARALREASRGSSREAGCSPPLSLAGLRRWMDSPASSCKDSRFAQIVERDLRDGQHRNPTDRLDYFTTAYFHRPDELADEVRDAGLDLKGVYGLEGPGWILPDVGERMVDVLRRDMLLDVARKLEAEPAVVGWSAHLLAVAQRPNGPPSEQ